LRYALFLLKELLQNSCFFENKKGNGFLKTGIKVFLGKLCVLKKICNFEQLNEEGFD
jgi:hypothetical protein